MNVNHKKVWRLWGEEGLQFVRRTCRKRAGASSAAEPPLADYPNPVRGCEFQHDATRDGRGFKIASMVDAHPRKSLLDFTPRSIYADVFTSELALIIAERGAPEVLRCANGVELISDCLRRFCHDHRVKIRYISLDQPWRTGHDESFNN
jgi:putative transposase